MSLGTSGLREELTAPTSSARQRCDPIKRITTRGRRASRTIKGTEPCNYGGKATMGGFELPPAFVPVGLSGLLGLLVMTLLTKWDKHQ